MSHAIHVVSATRPLCACAERVWPERLYCLLGALGWRCMSDRKHWHGPHPYQLHNPVPCPHVVATLAEAHGYARRVLWAALGVLVPGRGDLPAESGCGLGTEES